MAIMIRPIAVFITFIVFVFIIGVQSLDPISACSGQAGFYLCVNESTFLR
jgi:hypothetical protein